jgi:hypothetical protein
MENYNRMYEEYQRALYRKGLLEEQISSSDEPEEALLHAYRGLQIRCERLEEKLQFMEGYIYE